MTAILEPATDDGNPDVAYQASANIDEGPNTFDAFHAALSGGCIVASDSAYDGLGSVERVRLGPDEGGDTAE